MTNTAKSGREGLDPYRQLRLKPEAPLQERRAYAGNTAGLALAIEATNVFTSTTKAIPQRESTPRVHNLKEKEAKLKEKAKEEAKAKAPVEIVTKVTRALTVLPVPLGLRYLLGSLLVV